MDRNLSIEVVRVTEAAALASARLIGRGNKNEADEAATTLMREVLRTIPIQGTVVIGEGEMDEAPMLYIGEHVGNGEGIPVDVAVDPIEGTTLVANGELNALSVIAIANQGQLLHAPDMYMYKLAVGPEAAGKIDINAPLRTNLEAVAKAKNKAIDELTVTILQRPKHEPIIAELRAHGVRVKLIDAGDVCGAISTGFDYTGVDMLIGEGGAPEGVLAAVALKCLGGEIQGKLVPKNDEERKRCIRMGIDVNKTLMMDDFVSGDDAIFAATGITDGELLKGVQLNEMNGQTHSLVMRAKTGTVRFIEGAHCLVKKPNLVLS